MFLLFKGGLGSALAILLANALGLFNSYTAAIITLLTIQNTKKETLLKALKRILSFIIAIIISYIMFRSFGYTTLAFGGFIFIFVGISNIFNLKDEITVSAVLTTHFLIEKTMGIPIILNELALLFVGVSIGMILNLLTPGNQRKIKKNQRLLEDKMRDTLKHMAETLRQKEKTLIIQNELDSKHNSNNILITKETIIDLQELDELSRKLLNKAYDEAGNILLEDTRYMLSYLEMRKLQIEVLKSIMENINEIYGFIPQIYLIAGFMERVGNLFHEFNDVKELLDEIGELNQFFKKDKLPITREEFENRAILFQILKKLEYFLILKRTFIIEE